MAPKKDKKSKKVEVVVVEESGTIQFCFVHCSLDSASNFLFRV
jgi:hypothetical protein